MRLKMNHVPAFLVLCLSAQSACAQPDVAFFAWVDGFWQVWIMTGDGKEPRQITRSMSDKTRASWYPDGRQLLVNSNQGVVTAVDIESGRERTIDLGVAPVLDAVLSPDGLQIAFSFNGAESPDGNDIWLAGSDGARRRRITDMPELQHQPTWSADGRLLYFLSGGGNQAHDIWKMDVVSGSREQITVADLYYFDVSVSAAGELAFSSNRSGNYEIYRQQAGQKPEALTSDPGLDGHPTFSPDGKRILFESSRSGELQIWAIDTASRALSQLTHQKVGARAPVWRTAGAVPIR
jgi:TolB protein